MTSVQGQRGKSMRLIDADKLKFVPALIEPVLVGDEPHWETIILKDRIDNAPTIDAIPIEYIQQWLDKQNYGRRNGKMMLAKAFNELISEWREGHDN